ncbi:DUF899 domain-containing protein [Actinoplanes sp. TRM 88003]|uniref:DUF899 domain-containing protein n=1 Tax=Paractinoplanes aksuensis TaxID=2939490 RepID=A0ABT1DG92_9ACTN|nr:DUF899 family protein [Actinoplanes aksuensis]MCO8269855.1 DUF899 domain-containing protein [Actinoplanes aksuensis]
MTTTPNVVDLDTWQVARDELLVREKAYTRAGDALAAERRRLPMVEFDPAVEVVGGGAGRWGHGVPDLLPARRGPGLPHLRDDRAGH